MEALHIINKKNCTTLFLIFFAMLYCMAGDHNLTETDVYFNIKKDRILIDSVEGPQIGDTVFYGEFFLIIDTINIKGQMGLFHTPFGEIPIPLSDVPMEQDTLGNWYIPSNGNLPLVVFNSEPDYFNSLNLNTDTLSIGQEICREKGTTEIVDSTGMSAGQGLDAWGFDSTGVHHATGDTIDPNGFLQNGNHVETGTPYNPCGCNRESLTSDGKSCNPDDCKKPTASQAFADSLRGSLGDTIVSLIENIRTSIQDSLSTLNCGTLRSQLNNLVTNNIIDRVAILGPNDKLLERGMSSSFDKQPSVLGAIQGRDPVFKSIESNHVDLYRCDKKDLALSNLDTLLNNILTDTSLLFSLRENILSNIADWPTGRLLALSSDHTKFIAWLKEQIGKSLNAGELEGLFALNISSDPFGTKSRHEIMDKFGNRSFDSHPQFVVGLQSISLLSDFFPKAILDSIKTLPVSFDNGIVETGKIQGRTLKTSRSVRQFAIYKRATSPPLNFSDGMPIIIEKLIGNKTYQIIIDRLEVYSTHYKFTAYCIIHDTRSDRDLVFQGDNITIDGAGQMTNAQLTLLTAIQINLFNSVRLTLLPTSGTFVKWDVDGFESMSIDATVEVCRNVLVPLEPVTFIPKPEPELFAFGIQVQDISEWLEFTLTVNGLSPFAIAGTESQVAFELTNLILDFSSDTTPAFTPVDGYTSPYYQNSTMADAWKGMYIENISATILKDLSSDNANVQIAGQHLLIDGDGFTGTVSGTNVLSSVTGSMSGWPLSIDDIHLTFIKNSLHGGGIGGGIGLPISDDVFPYKAQVDQELNMSFTISPPDSLDFDMLVAKVYFTKNSSITAESINGDFILSAKLHGKLDVDDVPSIAGIQIYLPDIKFANLHLSTEAPHFKAGDWGLADGSVAGCKVGSFSLLIKKLKGVSDDSSGLSGVSFDLNLNLSGSIDISATGGLAILGKMHEENGRDRWRFEKVAIHKFAIDGSFPGVKKLKGSIEWFGNYGAVDTTYGKGFHGTVHVEFEGISVAVTAVALFGRIEAKGGEDAFKYFMVDAYADFGGLGSAGTFILTGFGGGIAHHMSMDATQISLGIANPDFDLTVPGSTISGAVLKPDIKTGLSLNANVGFAVFSTEIFNGIGGFRIEFTESFALNRIVITGAGQFMQSVDLNMAGDHEENATEPPLTSSPLSAYVSMDFNFGESSLHGKLQVFLNTPILYGAGEGRKLVDAELHFSPTEWYIYIGRPEEGQRCGLVVDLGGLRIEATAYFDVGTDVPSMPPLPQTVRELAYKVNTNESLRQSGAGMVFGAALTIEIAIKIGAIAEGGLEAGVGFDVMMKKYKDLHCQGDTGPVGINGWYASGQMWAYLRGYLKIFGVDVFEAGIAAVLQTRMPNPFWAQATVGVKVKIGPFNAKKSIKLELGQDCILVSNSGSNEGIGMDIISFINPYDGALDNELYFTPDVEFAVPIGRVIEIPNLQDPNIVYVFNTAIEEVKFFDSDSIDVPFKLVFNEDSSFVSVEPIDFLESADTFTMTILVSVSKDGANIGEEFKFTSFTTTAKELDIIPASNIKAAYPVNGMWNYYRSYNQGYIDLARGQPKLFSEYYLPENTRQFMRLTASDGVSHYVDYEYDGLKSIITFDLSDQQLNPQYGYKLEIVRVTAPKSSDSNLQTSNAGGIQSKNDWNTPTNSSVHDKSPVAPKEKIIYTAYFRVSGFETFEDKFNAINSLTRVPTGPTSAHTTGPGKYVKLQGELLFDGLELYGNTFSEPLLTIIDNIGANTKSKISSIRSKLRSVDTKLEKACLDKVFEFPQDHDLFGGVRVSSRYFSTDSTNLFTPFRRVHLESGHDVIENSGTQAVIIDLKDISDLAFRKIKDCRACFIENCQAILDNFECGRILDNTGNLFTTTEINNADASGILSYKIGDNSYFTGSLKLN